MKVDEARLGMVAPIRLPVEQRLRANLEAVLVELVVGALILRAVHAKVQLLLVEVFVSEDPRGERSLRGAHPRDVQQHHASVAVGDLLAGAAGLVPAALEVLHLVGLGAHDVVQVVPVAWHARPGAWWPMKLVERDVVDEHDVDVRVEDELVDETELRDVDAHPGRRHLLHAPEERALVLELRLVAGRRRLEGLLQQREPSGLVADDGDASAGHPGGDLMAAVAIEEEHGHQVCVVECGVDRHPSHHEVVGAAKGGGAEDPLELPRLKRATAGEPTCGKGCGAAIVVEAVVLVRLARGPANPTAAHELQSRER
mmetsp:Transcript_26951/g.64129  ORF Transcript_26951/g.64129 Transcript_26951/m.64129 type:complete len:313 (-) Transcript_26951:1067-2005(-)